MEMNVKQRQDILQSVRRRLGKSVKFKGKFIPPQQDASCCPTTPATQGEFVPSAQPKFSAEAGSLKPLALPGARQ
jgi:hypothetical protein